jgi:hypothetical protein
VIDLPCFNKIEQTNLERFVLDQISNVIVSWVHALRNANVLIVDTHGFKHLSIKGDWKKW